MAVVAIHEGKKMRVCRRCVQIHQYTNKKVILSRDAQWLNLFGKHNKIGHNNTGRQQVEFFLKKNENLSLERNDPEE